MKIALVVPGGVDRSGEFRVIPALLALIKRLAARHRVHVYALRQEPEPASWDLLGARIHNVGPRWTRARAVRAIWAEHRSAPFDLVHSIWSGACGLIAVSAARVLGVPSMVHVAGGEPMRLPEIGFGGRLTLCGRMQEAIALGGAAAVTAASAPLIRRLAELGIVAERLPLGVDLDIWPTRPPVRRDFEEPFRLIHVATLNRVKDQHTLLKALACVVRTRAPLWMDVVGEDTLHGEIQRLARDFGLAEHVRFRGFLTQEQLVPLVRAAHLMVISSRHEAGPLAMLEAAALGVPTVGTAVGHIAEWAPAAASAVPVGDWQALAGAIEAVIANEALRLALGREAVRRAAAESADYTAQRIEALYAQLAQSRA